MNHPPHQLHPNLNPISGSIPPPHRHLLPIPKTPGGPDAHLCPPLNTPAATRLPASFPSLSAFRAQDSSRHLTRGLSAVYLPLDWCSRVPSTSIWKHLPSEALAHLTRPLQERVRRFPVSLHTPLPPGSNIPPLQLMLRTYHAL